MYGRKKYPRKSRKVYRKRNISRLISTKIYKAFDKKTESKFVDTNFTDNSMVSGTWLFAQLTATSQGLGDASLRIGDRIRLKNLQFKFNVVASDSTNRTRVIVFRWNDDSTYNPPSSGQVLQSTSSIQSYFNYDTISAGKMTILFDKIVDVETTGGESQKFYKKYMKLKMHTIAYNAATSGGTGNLYVVYGSDSALTPHPTLDWTSRVIYKDA